LSEEEQRGGRRSRACRARTLCPRPAHDERDFFIDNLLVRIHARASKPRAPSAPLPGYEESKRERERASERERWTLPPERGVSTARSRAGRARAGCPLPAHETTGYEPFDLDAPKHWAISGDVSAEEGEMECPGRAPAGCPLPAHDTKVYEP